LETNLETRHRAIGPRQTPEGRQLGPESGKAGGALFHDRAASVLEMIHRSGPASFAASHGPVSRAEGVP
jgi:hypothetical protein